MGRVTQIPFPGGSGATPTGALQFQQDWPGLFVRGDDAVQVLGAIRRIQDFADKRKADELTVPLMLLGKLADIIDRDVLIGNSQSM